MRKIINIGLAAFMLFAIGACGGEKSVKIGNQVWMAKNLNDASKGGRCYEDNPENCEKYGRLYTWDEAMKACPSGWHLPNNAELGALVSSAGGIDAAGGKLKARSGWENGSDSSTDEYGFSALPGGYGDSNDGGFSFVGVRGIWWNAIEGSSDGTGWGMGYDFSSVSEYDDVKSLLFSVRCVKGNAPNPTAAAEQNQPESEPKYIPPAPGSQFNPNIKYSSFTDKRDEQTYRTVKIGNLTWMAQNLNFKYVGSVCYDDDEANCAIYGRLYDAGDEEACPEGWRFPSDAEWEALASFTGGKGLAGGKLKSKSGWENNGNGTDDFGFSALPGGIHTIQDEGEGFVNIGGSGSWWSSSRSYGWAVFSFGSDLGLNGGDFEHKRSVRCVNGNAPNPAAAETKEIAVLEPVIGTFVRYAKDGEEPNGDTPFMSDPNGNFYDYGDIGGSDGGSYEEEFTASSTLAPQGKISYEAANLENKGENYSGDRSVTWCEGVKGHGIGERVNLRIKMMGGKLSYFSSITIVNGYAKNRTTWQSNSRAKKILLYVDGKPWLYLNLKDVIEPQSFNLSDKIPSENLYKADLSFEIMEVYPGSKFDDLCITGITLSGHDETLCFAKGTKILMANNALKNIESIQSGDLIKSYDFESKRMKGSKVSKLVSAPHSNLLRLKFVGNEIVTTDDHPFWTEKNGWSAVDAERANKNYVQKTAVAKLKSGDKIFIPAQNTYSELIDIEKIAGQQITYTIELTESDNFIANGMLVKTEVVK